MSTTSIDAPLSDPPMQWFRFYQDVTLSPLVRDLTDFEFRVFVAMFCLAGRSVGSDWYAGRLTVAPTGKPVSVRMIAVEAWAEDDAQVEAALSTLCEKGLVAVGDDGVYQIAWRWNQYKTDNVTKRTQAHRARKKQQGNLVASLPEHSNSEQGTAEQSTPEQSREVRSQERSHDGVQEDGDEYPCPTCAGSGLLDGSPCGWCEGSGVCTR